MSQATIDNLMAKFQKAWESAREANEARYSEILGQYEGVGDAQVGDVNTRFNNLQGVNTLRRIRTGTGNVTDINSPQIEQGRQRSVSDIRDRVSMAKAGVMERRTDSGPDIGLFVNLIREMAAGKAGSGGGFNWQGLLGGAAGSLVGGIAGGIGSGIGGGIGSAAGGWFGGGLPGNYNFPGSV